MCLKADIASYVITKNDINTMDGFWDIHAERSVITEKSLGQVALWKFT